MNALFARLTLAVGLFGSLLTGCGQGTNAPVERTGTQHAALSTDGLVAAYGFDEGSGQAVHDATSAGQNAELSGQNWILGRFGSALEFDHAFLDVATTPALDLTNAMTLTAWVLPKPGEAAEAMVLAKEYEWDASYQLSAETWWGAGPRFDLHGSDWHSVDAGGHRLPTSKWSHLAATYDGASMKLYVDGELRAENEYTEGAQVIDSPLRIGGMTWERFFHGRIDEVRVYNRALSASEIAEVMTEPVTAGAVADTTAPTVAMTAPAAGGVSGQVVLTADASDAGGVGSVQFLVDGQPYGYPVLAPPYQLNWHSRSATAGSHELSARATDVTGNESVSAPVVVTVDAANTTPGLVAAFSFDEGTGDDVHDATGAGHDTVRSGQDWIVGKFGSALEFEDSFVEVPGSSLLDVTHAMTVSAWVLPKTQFEELTILAKEQLWDTSFELYAASWYGGPRWNVLGSNWGTTEAGSPLPTTKWSHVAGTYDGATIKLYVDGALVDETPFDEGAQVTNTPLHIGGMSWQRYFRGRIDEVRIYNRVLSASEIAEVMTQPVTAGSTTEATPPAVAMTAPVAAEVSGQVGLAAEASDAGGVATVQFLVDGQPYGYPLLAPPYQLNWHSGAATAGAHELSARATDFAGNVSVSTPVVVTVDAANTTPGLVAAYGFDEGSGNDVHDATGAGHDTVLTGQHWVVGKYGSALEFEDSFLEVAGDSLLDVTNAVTVSAWVLPKVQYQDMIIVAKEKLWDSSFEFYAGTPRGGPLWGLVGSSWEDTEAWNVLPTSRWSHVAGTYDGVAIKLYVDGALVDETPFDEGAQVTNTPLRIGGMTWERFFKGRLDEIRIYNRALSGSEIAAVMTQPVTAGATSDTTGPSVALTTPAAGEVSGQVAMVAEASDAGGVESVQFLVDGQPYGYPVLAPPYQMSWHSNSATAGSHELQASAIDFAGNVTVSAPVVVTVDAANTTPGLVAAYGFDEGSGEDVHEATGTGLDTLRSGQTWVAGKFGSALAFDEGWLEIGRSPLLNLTTDLTLAAWVLPQSVEPSEAPIVAKEDLWKGSYLLNANAYYAGPRLELLGVDWGRIESPARLSTTAWSHVAATYAQNQAKLYVNGALVAEGPIEGPIQVTDTPFRIGGTFSWSSQFHGRIDEVRIYNRALSGSEIAGVMTEPVSAGAIADVTPPAVAMTAPVAGAVTGQVMMVADASDASGVASVQFLVDGQPYGYPLLAPPYQLSWHSNSAAAGSHELSARATDIAGNASVSGAVSVTVDAANTTPGLVAAYSFDEGSGENVHEGTGTGLDAVLSGQTWVAGKFGSALDFDADFLEIGRANAFDLTTAMTLSAWVLPKPGEATDAPVIAKEDLWQGSYLLNANGYYAGPRVSLLGAAWGDFATIETPTRVPTTGWSHVAATYEQNQLKLYVNGELVAEGPTDRDVPLSDTPLRIGGTFSWGSLFHGRIDEVRIYNRALSGSEIAEVMTQPVAAGATADTTAPTVALTAPSAGPVSGQVAMVAVASDASGVENVQFLVDGQPYGYALRTPPYQLNWHARAASPGSHELSARATDFAGNVNVSAPVVVTVEAANTTPGLVAAYSFDEGSGVDVHDATGAGQDTVRTTQNWVGGRFGNALEFADGYLEVEGSYLLDLTTAMTVSMWVLPEAGYMANTVLLEKEYEFQQSYALSAGNWASRPEWALRGNDWANASGPGELPSTKWTHLAGTYDGQTIRLYLDGQLAGETEFEGGAQVTDTPLRIGGMTWGNNFRGRIDEVRIYNRALSASEIGNVMLQPVNAGALADTTPPSVALTAPAPGTVSGSVLIAAQAADSSGVRQVELLVDGVRLGEMLTTPPYEKHWFAGAASPGTHELRARATDRSGNVSLSAPVNVVVEDTGAVPGLVAAFGFDEGTGEAVHDATGAGHDTTVTGQTWATGKYGGALAFDGAYLTVADSDLLDLTTGMTLSAWVRPTAFQSNWPTVMLKEWDGALAYALYAGSNGSTAPSTWYRSLTSQNEIGDVANTGLLELGLWTHLAATFDGAHLKLFVNGEPTIVDVASEESIVTTSGPLRIGGNGVWNSEWFYGLIDEVRVYNRALSQAEITADMARPVSEGAAPDTTPPQVAITSPAAGSTVYGNVMLRAQASDAYGIESVQFFADGVAVGGLLTSAPFETSWNTGPLGAGSHTLRALAFDRSGNSAYSVDVAVTLSDTPPACDPATVSDGNPCTADSCNAQGQPVFAPLAAGMSCSDGDRCNGVEACNGSGVCAPGTPPSTDATCDGLDDDCDGQIDEDYVGASTSCGVGACARSETGVCQNGSIVATCTPGTPAANDATCNGVDDDCDGSIDEDYVAVATSCGVGSCAATGSSSCVHGAVVNSCTPGAPAASDTTCNGVDNDCDGSIDEDYVGVGTSCGVGACAATGTSRCEAGQVVSGCTAGTPAQLDASCDGIDNDCDGSTDEDYSPEPVNCGVGACVRSGQTRCQAGSITSACTPGTPASDDASCNGVDDDCDGSVDEDYAGHTTSCGSGSCTRSGTTACQAGHEVDSCHAGAGAPADTVCNGIDDDCDGSVDEDFVPTTTTCGVGVCAATGTSACQNGAVVPGCTAGSPTGDDSTCNGVDDDCDGSVDEAFVPLSVSCGVGACHATGVTHCEAGVETPQCTAGTPAVNDTTCNGVDDDCDGSTDEDFVQQPTSCGQGACAATGHTVCQGGQPSNTCHAGQAAVSDSTCNGVDDDCDGSVDEEYAGHVTSCGVGACAATGTSSCVNGAEQPNCSAHAAAANDANCNGADDDCDGSVDEDYLAAETHCGVGACTAIGHARCVAGQLEDDCHVGSGSTQDSSCNGVDDDCDGSVDEDYVTTPTSCGAGACARTGNLHCQGGSVVNDCAAGTPAASDATCNGVDDDCDGSTDEDYLSTPTTCAQGACQATGQTQCVGGTVEDSCAPGTASASDATCDGLDNDCDGAVDEGYVAHGTTCGVGACARTGTTSCVSGHESDNCQPAAAAANDAVCNGVDDDCDGSTDEDYVATATTCGVGACAASGQLRCQGGALVNDCAAGAPASDANCNGVDDDCDGSVDEDYVPVATSCGVGACAATGMSRCEAGHIVSGCTAGTPATLDASCDGVDNDCDGSTDEDYQPEPASCGVGACMRSGQTRCQAGTVELVCTPGTAAANDASCNGVDDDCNGTVDEDYVAHGTACGQGSCTNSGTTACQNGQEVDSCRPRSGSASDTVCNGIDDDCDGSIDDDYVPTQTTCGVGACAATGTSACQNGAVVPGCTAGSPTGDDSNCNGVDDDCDGSVDEAYVPQPVSCGVGACRATGVTSCTAGVEAPQCTPGTAAANDVTCNGIDDDCDNSVDEDFVQQPTSCGQGACAAAGHTACESGQARNTCVAGQPASGDATCNGVDDDCDGSTDEDYVATPTSCGAGACARSGTLRCQGGNAVNDCTAGNPAASDATCNGIDDDCDGSIDEDYLSTPTTCSVGACQAAGETHCVGGTVEDSCTPGTTTAADETCDGVDNDCDGAVDEGYVAHGTTCGVGACARTGNTSCVAGHEANSCQPGSAATGDATCNGVDDDCDGTSDEDYVATATTCGVGACAATGQNRCQGGAVVNDCTAGNPTSDANCNGVDDDCDGSIDEDYVPVATSCGVGACAASGTSRCEAGHVVSGCTAGTPATLDASCDGIDNDCDGTTDEDYVPEPVSCGVGACVRSGQTRCQAGTVEPVCTPGTAAANDSSCNGIDDDCNGTVDEDYVARSTSCGQGSCTNSGTTACQAGQEVDSCRPRTGSSNDTVCNGIDDDCDGSVDEDFAPTTTTCGVGVCAATGTSACQNGAVVPGCTAGNPTGDDSNCNGVDDDCDGSVDEAYVPLSVSCGVGACHATGVTSCEAGVEAPQCTPGTAAANDATCNGIDDDCDNSVDEDFVEVPTSCGQGACAATGHTACQGGQPKNTCTAGQPATSDGTCNGVDDDCDGSTDEDYAGHATNCGVGACAATGTSTCVSGAEQPNCSPRAAAPNDSSCNSVDDDCDGSVDEDYVGTATSCGQGACAATGTTTCSAGQVGNTCQAGTPASGDTTCNGVDDDCDGALDEDYVPQETVCGVGACRTTGAIACQNGQIRDTCTPLPKSGNDDDCNGVDDDCDGQTDEAFAARCSGSAIETCASGALQTQECQDQDVCNGSESCSAAHCVAGTPIPTNDNNPCTADSCSAGGVSHTALALGSDCGQGKVCDGQGACIGKPVITTQPASVSVSPGADAAFGVTATGALLTYQWRRLGQPIGGATSTTLVLPSVQPADTGAEITVAVSNPAGTVVSSPATLTVSDTTGPALTIDGEAQRSVSSNTLLITGTALDNGQPAASLTASSSRFPGEVAGIIDPGSGAFKIEVPVSPGANTITITAKDAAGNATQKSVVATLELSRLPTVTITAPANGTETDAEKVNVTGYVRSSLPPEQIRLVLGTSVLFPSGTGGEYSFAFNDVRLNFGPNLLSVRAETPDGTITAMAAVLRREPGEVSTDAPVVAVIGGSSLQFVKDSSLPIKGTVSSKRCTSSVTVNGNAATLVGAGSEISFNYTLALPSGDEEVPVEIKATDCDGRFGYLNYKVIHDDVAPVIEVALAPSPAVHNVSTTPYLIVGKITESHLATVTSNQQSLGVLPGAIGSYDFNFAVPLTRGQDDIVTVEAVDQAGNHATYSLTLHLDAAVEIEVIAPVSGSEIQTLKDPVDVDVVARIVGLPADFSANVRLDNGGIYPLTRADSTFKTTLSVRGLTASHTAAISVLNGDGTSVASKGVTFKVTDVNSIPIQASLKTPANGSSNVEANEPIVVELNRPVADPQKIKIEVTETVHGKRYKPYALGASVNEFTNVQLEDINSDQGPVPGGMSFLPGDRLYAFYPARDYGYGGTVTVRVTNDGAELLRGQFNVRPLPTLATGFIADQFLNPLPDIDVRLDDIQVTTQTNGEGVFSFGFGKASDSIPSGRHKLVVNAGLKNRKFGMTEQWVNLQDGRLADLGMVSVPELDAGEPFRHLEGGASSVLLRGGDLELDLSQAGVTFPDGTTAGDVHTDFFVGPAVRFPAITIGFPFITYGLQPMGLQVTGSFSVNFALPAVGTSDDYVDGLPEYVMLIGLDADALQLVPIGVGRVDKAQHRVRSARPLTARRLDFIGMSPLMGASFQSLFSQFADGSVDLDTLIMAVENSR